MFYIVGFEISENQKKQAAMTVRKVSKQKGKKYHFINDQHFSCLLTDLTKKLYSQFTSYSYGCFLSLWMMMECLPGLFNARLNMILKVKEYVLIVKNNFIKFNSLGTET